MGKLEENKEQKKLSLLGTAFDLFTTKGVGKTSIAEISAKAGIAKGTFYLYFKDKYDIRNKLIAHESSRLFRNALCDLENLPRKDFVFEDKMLYIIEHIIRQLDKSKTLLNFISKNLSWGIFKEALTNPVSARDLNFNDIYYDMLFRENITFKNPEVMLFMIIELVSSTCYSVILYSEPVSLEQYLPYLYGSVLAIINEHKGA